MFNNANFRFPGMQENPTTTFKAALPYGIISCATSLTGTALALTATATALKVAAVFIGIIGVYTFISVILCALKNSDNPAQFNNEIHAAMLTSTGTAIVTITNQIVSAVLNSLIDRLIYGENQNRINIRLN